MRDSDVILEQLRRSDLFASVPSTELESLVLRAKLQSLDPPASVFEQGTKPDSAYMVLEGEVRIVSTSLEGNLIAYRRVGPGEIFGEVGVLDQMPRTSGATAVQRCLLLVIPAARFLALLESHGVAALHLARTLARRIRTTTEMLEDAVFLSARRRVAKKLLELARTTGRNLPEGGLALENVTHETLASMVALHRVTVTTQIAHLERAGLLQSQRGRIVLLDLPALGSLLENA
jgi:CRP/FNR family transcriptional regulator, cyclic AMP receptor protein